MSMHDYREKSRFLVNSRLGDSGVEMGLGCTMHNRATRRDTSRAPRASLPPSNPVTALHPGPSQRAQLARHPELYACVSSPEPAATAHLVPCTAYTQREVAVAVAVTSGGDNGRWAVTVLVVRNVA